MKMTIFKYFICLLVVLFISSVVASNSDYEMQVKGEEIALCPKWHFCSAIDSYGVDPKCGCEEPCLRVGSCCVDYLQGNNRSIEQPPPGLPVKCFNTTKKDSFYLVHVCNDTWPDDSVRDLCEETNSKDTLSNLPVSDPNGIDYKNVYCSTCNYIAEENVVAWRIELECDQSVTSITSLKHIPEECDVEYKALQSSPTKCDINIIDSCAEGYSTTSEELRLCRTYSASTNINGTMYKNPHCVACNNVEITYINCTSLVLETSDTNWNPGFGLQTKSLSVLFDFSGGRSTKINSRYYDVHVGTCAQNEIYDPFVEKCIAVSCAHGFQYVNGECRQNILEEVSRICESSSLAIEYVTLENPTSSITCILENIKMEEVDVFNMKVGQCNESNCFHVGLNILDFNSSLPEDLKALFDMIFLRKDAKGYTCSIVSIDIEHFCKSAHHGALKTDDWKFNRSTTSQVLDVDWCYGFSFDSSKQLYNTTSEKKNCDIIYRTNLTCPFVVRSSTQFYKYGEKPDYIVHKDSGNIFAPSEYEYLKNGSVLVCQDSYIKTDSITDDETSSTEAFLTQLCIILSLAALLVTFILYCRFKPLRTLPGKSVMNLVAALFFALLIFLLGSGQTQHDKLCTSAAILQHFFFLASFFWMNVLSFDVRRTFNFQGAPQNAHRKRNTLIMYAVYAWGSPAIVVGICLILIYSSFELDIYYGNSDVCMIGNTTVNLVAFGGPVALTLALNFVFFVLTVVSIRKTKQVTKVVESKKTKTKSRLQELLIYAKLSTLMGMSWISGFVAALTNSNVVWYFYIVLNALQGVFVFVFFVCNSRVYKLMKGGKTDITSKTKSTDFKSTRTDSSMRKN